MAYYHASHRHFRESASEPLCDIIETVTTLLHIHLLLTHTNKDKNIIIFLSMRP